MARIFPVLQPDYVRRCREAVHRFFLGEATKEELKELGERQLSFDFEQSKRRLQGPKGGH